MGNCCQNKPADAFGDDRQPIHNTQNQTNVRQSRNTRLNATSQATLRKQFERQLRTKEEAIARQQAQIEMKELKLKQLQQAGKTLDSQKLLRQIDTHRNLITQAEKQREKIQKKLNEL